MAERVEVLTSDVDAVDEDLAALDIVEAHHECGDGGLAGAGVADDGGGFVGVDGEGDTAENPLDVLERGSRGLGGGSGRREIRLLGFGESLIREPDILELDAAVVGAGGGWGDDFRGRDDGGALVEQFEDALGGGHGGLQDVVLVGELHDGAEEALRVLDKGDEHAEGDGAEDAGRVAFR